MVLIDEPAAVSVPLPDAVRVETVPVAADGPLTAAPATDVAWDVGAGIEHRRGRSS